MTNTGFTRVLDPDSKNYVFIPIYENEDFPITDKEIRHLIQRANNSSKKGYK